MGFDTPGSGRNSAVGGDRSAPTGQCRRR